VSSRIKTLGVAAAFAAIAVAIPTAVQAYAEPGTEPTDTTSPAAGPTTTSTIPVPVMSNVPDPQGPGCDDYKKQVSTGAGSFKGMATQSASEAIASNPDLSTFNDALSGKLNPGVNIVSVLDGGPYVVFAPTNKAFEKLGPAEMAALETDPAQLTSLLFYHMVLGYLGPDDVHGNMTTQDGRQINVTGKGGDIKVNDTAKVVCGGITTRGASLYMIDEVLDPADAPDPNTPSTTSTTSTTETSTSSTETSSTETSPLPAESADGTSATPSATETPSG